MTQSKARSVSLLANSLNTSGDVTADGIASTVSLGASVYDSVDQLPYSGNNAGDQAFVNGTNRLYLWAGSGWYNVALINRAPTISSVQDSDGNTSPFALAIDGTATTITITAADSDGDPITYSAVADSDFNGLATITGSGNEFTITPFSQDSATTSSGAITFKATDGINITSSINTFTLSFVSDYWDETVLSIGTSSTNSLDNSTFIDRSTNAHTVTPTGAPAQTAFHPYLDNWSVQFDGSGDYLTLGSAVDLSTGDFTVEAWVNFPDDNTDYVIVSGSATGDVDFRRISDGTLRVGRISVAWDTYTGALNLANEWHHVAFVRNSGVVSIYVDGVSQSVTGASNTNNYQDLVYVGRNTSIYSKGFYSNIRISDIARYTENFTPSTEALSSDNDTLYLLCQSNRFIDNGPNTETVTPSGDVKISSFNPFGQGSEYDVGENKGSVSIGSGNYLTTDPSVPATDDFTLECWIYPTDITAGFQQTQGIYGQYQNGGSNVFLFYMIGGVLRAFGGSSSVIVASTTFTNNQWYHIAMVRSSGSDTIYINGTNEGTGYIGTISQVYNAIIGFLVVESRDYSFRGTISDLKVTDSAVYTSNFTPPTSPLGNTNADLYLPMDNAGIFDKTGNATVDDIRSVSTSTSQTKYADTSLYYSASDSYLVISENTDFADFGTGDWTVEGWVYATAYSNNATIVGASLVGTVDTNQTGWSVNIGNSINATRVISRASGSWQDDLTVGSGQGVPLNTWCHFAVCKDGDNLRIFINGSIAASRTGVSSWNYGLGGTGKVLIGAFNDGNNLRFHQGYLENIQILRGLAKYTTNFTVPDREQGRTYQVTS